MPPERTTACQDRRRSIVDSGTADGTSEAVGLALQSLVVADGTFLTLFSHGVVVATSITNIWNKNDVKVPLLRGSATSSHSLQQAVYPFIIYFIIYFGFFQLIIIFLFNMLCIRSSADHMTKTILLNTVGVYETLSAQNKELAIE